MLRPSYERILLSLTLMTALAAASPASAQTSWKLYDLRDLIGSLPPPPRVEAAAVTRSVFTIPAGGPTAPRPGSAGEPTGSTRELMDRLCAGLGVAHTALLPGVYGIEAEETGHTALVNMLEQVRELFTERYEVEILWFVASPDQAPSIGDPVTPTGPLHRHRLVAARRTPTELVHVSQYTYVSGINPIVAQQAVGYGPETRREESGLRLSILVGAGSETDTATSLQVTGDLRRVAMGKMSGPLITDAARSMELELPQVSVRSIRSSIRIEYGKLTALGVTDGFDDGQCVVIAASVRKLSS